MKQRRLGLGRAPFNPIHAAGRRRLAASAWGGEKEVEIGSSRDVVWEVLTFPPVGRRHSLAGLGGHGKER